MFSQYLIYYTQLNIFSLRHITFVYWCFLTFFTIISSIFFLKEEIYLFFNLNFFEISLNVDFLSIVFFNTLIIIVTSVLFFRKEYIQEEILIFRFLLFKILFVSSIILLIFGRRIFTLLIGWDGLGITSFFLVLFFQNSSSWRARIKTALTNRLGDGFLIIVFSAFLLRNNVFTEQINFVPTIFIFLLILGSFTKRAQFPFRNWLPAAIAAPTPISSLVHSSTLVTAGIFLIIRFSGLFIESYRLKIFIIVRGIMTIILAGLFALFEKDLKKVVALSTLRHLGLIRIGCSLVGPLFGFFHLIIHAIFKALLFINIGYLIINSGHNQDSRLLRLNSEYLSISVLFSLLRIIGFYFFNGFFSKDLIIFLVLSFSRKNILFFSLIFFGFCLTVAYSLRFFVSLFSYFKNIQINLRKTIFNSTFILIRLRLFLGEIIKNLLLNNYIFFYAEKISFFIPFFVILIGSFIYIIVSGVKSIYVIERIFFLNYILGNWLVKINNITSNYFNTEVNFSINFLIERKVSRRKIQNITNSLITFFFFLTIFFIWILFLFIILSSYSL